MYLSCRPTFFYGEICTAYIQRFLCFTPNTGHKAEELVDVILNILKVHNIDIANCRGQAYDNASNMSGIYTGLQARIKALNLLAYFAPRAAHSSRNICRRML